MIEKVNIECMRLYENEMEYKYELENRIFDKVYESKHVKEKEDLNEKSIMISTQI